MVSKRYFVLGVSLLLVVGLSGIKTSVALMANRESNVSSMPKTENHITFDSPSKTKWKYKMVQCAVVSSVCIQETSLNLLGTQGWELVSVTVTAGTWNVFLKMPDGPVNP